MRRHLSLPVLVLFLLALPLASCSDSAPLEPQSPPAALTPTDSADVLLGSLIDAIVGTTTTLVNGVLACPSSETYTATKTIGLGGGYIDVGPHRLVVPPYALRENVTITATAPAGPVTIVQFEPHGLEFKYSAALTMSYAHCGLISGLTKHVVYVDGQLNILEILPSYNDLWRRRVTGKLDHFSSYAVAE